MCFETRGVVLCMSHVVEIRMLSVCIIQEVKRKEVSVGRRDIYTPVVAIAWFNL